MWSITIHLDTGPHLVVEKFGLLDEASKYLFSDSFHKLVKDKEVLKIEFEFRG